jgi:hypothetical protein
LSSSDTNLAQNGSFVLWPFFCLNVRNARRHARDFRYKALSLFCARGILKTWEWPGDEATAARYTVLQGVVFAVFSG